MEEKGIINDSEMFLSYELFNKFLEHPEELTEADKHRLKEMGIEV